MVHCADPVQILKGPTARPGAQTAVRALDLLRLVVSAAEPRSATELARDSRLDPSATYRLLRALEAQGFVIRDGAAHGYTVGPVMVGLSAIVMSKQRLREVAGPSIRAMAEMTGETVSLFVREGAERVCLDTIESRQPVRRVVPVGERVPLFVGPSGKVILAFLPENEREAVLACADLDAAGLRRVRDQIASVLSKGCLATVHDRTPGVSGLSAPVFDSAGVVGSITASGPADRWNAGRMADLSDRFLSRCIEVSALMGAPR